MAQASSSRERVPEKKFPNAENRFLRRGSSSKNIGPTAMRPPCSARFASVEPIDTLPRDAERTPIAP